MSAWYVWSAMGMYPQTPGTPDLALGSPLFAQVVITLPSGSTLTINGNGAADNAPYVQTATWNGAAWNNAFLPSGAISGGGTFTNTLGTSANTSWASASSAAPPSYQGSGSNTSSSFSSGFESTDPQLTWSNTVDTTGGNISNVTGICCSLTSPEAGIRTGETAHTGSGSLMYSGSAQGGSTDYAYLKFYDLSAAPLAIGTGKSLSYWIYPQSNTTSNWVPASSRNSTCVAVDLIFTDGSTLRDSGAVDQTGNRVHPAYQCGHLTLDAWNHVIVNLGTNNAGKVVSRILVGYDQPNSTGGYRGYVDDLTIS